MLWTSELSYGLVLPLVLVSVDVLTHGCAVQSEVEGPSEAAGGGVVVTLGHGEEVRG